MAAWRWRNVPLPEPHLTGLGVGILAQVVRPWPLFSASLPGRVAGGVLIVGGVAVAAWAVRAAGAVDLERAGSVVERGPYARSRNPMYVGWTGLYAGLALVLGSAWLAVLLPPVLVWTHLVVLREERRLSERFGESYRAYAGRTRRYV